AIGTPTHLEIICATWCGDSKRHVPRLLKAVHEAANPNLTVSLVGIGNDFKQPIDYVQEKDIINVPIVILTRGGKEIGRFIETWAELDEHHAPDFAEVTERAGQHVVRTRYHADRGNWSVTSRGDEGGIVQQSMTAPSAFALPATPTLGWLLYAKRDALDAYVVDATSPNAVG